MFEISDFLANMQAKEHFFDIFQYIPLFFNSHLQCVNALRRYITISERLELPVGKIYLLALTGRNLNYLN